MRHIHRMPFGAEPDADGTRFRLWAPDARRVDLVLESPKRIIPLERDAAGWCEAVVPEAGTGTLYRYRIDGDILVPDPASRFQPGDVHGPSRVEEPQAYVWKHPVPNRPWAKTVLYELHVGTFTSEGTYRAAIDRLDHLVELGVTAIELMPVADFPGGWGWGYDGVLPFAPDAAYGTPDDLKALVDAAHGKGLEVFLDVVYNHFGPDGNYLHTYAEHFFNPRHHTPWGAAVNFDGPGCGAVRDFFIHNALYWLEEFRFDGLRLDAVHAICDDSDVHILDEIAEQAGGAGVLVLENDANEARRLDGGYAAQWNDDIHHTYHVLLTGEEGGYYADFAADPVGRLVTCLAEGFAWQGQPSPFRGGRKRGEPSAHLPPSAFVAFLQNHDQVGNRALGERIGALVPGGALRAATALLLLSPQPPLLFMGQEWNASSPFWFFCDLGPHLADAVRKGRRREFAAFPQFRTAKARRAIPDPLAPETFDGSKLDWSERDRTPHRGWLELHRSLLAARHRHLTPRLGARVRTETAERLGRRAFRVAWRLDDGSRLEILANLSNGAKRKAVAPPAGERLHLTGRLRETGGGVLPGPWTVAVHLDGEGCRHA